MIKIEMIKTMNWEGAFRGMRNPLESWNRSDSNLIGSDVLDIGDNDLKLAKTLIKAGSDHAKFLRQIFVSMDITAPDYFWKEFDTYKIGTVANSTSTMHKLGTRMLTKDDFSWDDFTTERKLLLFRLNQKITKYQKYIKKKDYRMAKATWRTVVQDLPMSFNYLRTVSLNYEVLRSMYHARKNHKLQEWINFCEIITAELPYSEFITIERTKLTQ